ncbi:hypothetical protein [Streptomyces lavendulocolor]|uniref:hypothetical protein n=1 Tax=Streptomyces lavendulocolor TaxID=67316 RepID=UPI003405814C
MVTTNLVINAQEKLGRRQRLDRIWRVGAAVSWRPSDARWWARGAGAAGLRTVLSDVIGTGIAWQQLDQAAPFSQPPAA